MICGFTEAGKKDGKPYIQSKVSADKLAELDTVIAKGIETGTLKAAGSLQRAEIQGYGLPMPQTEARLMTILDRLAANWKFRKPANLQVRIVGSLARVPMAHPDGAIIVPLGMLINARTDDEIAWLLGHEYAHLALGHFAREAKRKATQKHLSMLASFVPVGVELAQERMEIVNGKPKFIKTSDPAVVATGEQLMLRNNDLRLATALLNAFFSRKQEDQADVAGYDLLMAAHYDNSGVNGAIQLIAKDDQETSNFLEAFSKDFSAFSQKQIGASAGQALQAAATDKPTGDIFGNLLTSLGKNAGRIALNKLRDGYMRTHRPPDKRAEGLNKYFLNVYKTPPTDVEATNTDLQHITKLDEYQKATAALFAAHDALAIIAGNGSAEEALRKLKPAEVPPFERTPVIANAVAAVFAYAKQNQTAEYWYDIASGMKTIARAPAARPGSQTRRSGRARAAAIAPPSPQPETASTARLYTQSMAGYEQHLNFLIDLQRYPRALQVVDHGSRQLSDSDAFLPWLVLIHGKMRQTAKMLEVLVRCSALDDQVITRACQKSFLKASYGEGAYEALSPADQAEVDRAFAEFDNTARSGDIWQKVADSVRSNDDDDDKDEQAK